MKKGLIAFALLLGLSLSACIYFGQENAQCPVPINFSEKKLVGTWVTGLDIRHDTLIIRENRTYKQIIYVQSLDFDYESDWLPWSLQFSDAGLPYLHLNGMRLCVYWINDECQRIGGGDNIWYDGCKKEWVKMPNEGVLMVLGPPKEIKLPLEYIDLAAFTKSPDYTTAYRKQTP